MLYYMILLSVCLLLALPLICVLIHDKLHRDKEIQLTTLTGVLTIVPFALSLFMMLIFTADFIFDRATIRKYYSAKQRLECTTDGYEQAIYEAIKINEKLKRLMFIDKKEREYIFNNLIDADSLREREYESFRAMKEEDR